MRGEGSDHNYRVPIGLSRESDLVGNILFACMFGIPSPSKGYCKLGGSETHNYSEANVMVEGFKFSPNLIRGLGETAMHVFRKSCASGRDTRALFPGSKAGE